MSKELFEAALAEIRNLHESSSDMSAFQQFPGSDDTEFQTYEPFHILPADHMAKDQSIRGGAFETVCKALHDLKDHALWRETYRGTNIGEDFLSRFGCFELYGLSGHFHCETTRGFMVYSTSDLYYPWHHHPAEELYFILAGEAEFATEGNPAKLLQPGDTVFHKENQPHNMQTHGKGVLAWVQWRGDLETPPVLTDRLNGDL